ncbi:MAG: amino acid permease, partial [Saprospiraceae bacterium]|nr:amino acid permease [Saprospiraceae bacterium]
MSQAKKFGAFAGVFTPSILTILGVIMYMRLGWVVGEAGLIATIGIILLAHVISISTGLSISSIATDKKIKTGGIYYMLSRSLGLPMGGSIGISLFIGTALSISLYIVGFCENFLGINAISTFLGMEPSINSIRIVGTIVIIALVIIAFISTSFALKTQFFILGAIALSLISIFVGFFTGGDTKPIEIAMSQSANEIPLIVIFAIFFPAVTGFTAGVAMSGDLKDPKKSIPVGTMSAIVIGLVIYLSLAIAFAVFVDRDLLINDKNFLMKIAWFSPLVIAGIWGATLSSALGGILGGPRILQAISNDKIAPKFLGKGHGESNEPRNALILTFVIAEIGILIGKLDSIAEVVSMFYIAAYGFINLAYALESWASSDFRPTFKISRWIGIVGFIACFGIMFQLNPLAMIGAFVIMWLIYFILRKRELQLDFGDVWQSVFSSIVRTSLHRMDKKEIEERNWRPNIILFSGGNETRSHLMNFGKNLVGKHGFLSNFDLIENKDEKIFFPKHKQAFSSDESEQYKGIFTRRQTCNNIYDGIEAIAQTYGFSGIEPNTVFLGWGRRSEDSERFAQTIQTLSNLDLNILMMDYDKRYGFGQRKLIDIWWRGAGNNGNLALTLAKFLWLSDDWREAKVRLMIVNPNNDEKDVILNDAIQALDNLRIKADVKIINNQIERKTFYQIIRVESVNSDLIFIGVPEIEIGTEREFVKETNALCKDIGTVVLIKASTYFKDLKIGVRPESKEIKLEKGRGIDLVINETIDIPEIKFPDKNILANQLKSLQDDLYGIVDELDQDHISKLFIHHENFIKSFKELFQQSFSTLTTRVNEENQFERKKIVNKVQNKLFISSNKLIEEVTIQNLINQKEILDGTLKQFLDSINDKLSKLPKSIINKLQKEDLVPEKSDSSSLKWFKFNKRLRLKTTGKAVKYKIQYKKLVSSYLPLKGYAALYKTFDKWGLISAQFIVEIQKLTRKIDESFRLIANSAAAENLDEIVNTEMQKISLMIKDVEDLNKASYKSLKMLFLNKLSRIIQSISNDLNQINPNSFIPEDDGESAKATKKLILKLNEIPDKWKRNQELILNASYLEFVLLAFSSRLRTIYIDILYELSTKIDDVIISEQYKIIKSLKKHQTKLKKNEKADFNYIYNNENIQIVKITCKNIIDTTLKKIKSATMFFPDTIDLMSDESYNNFNKQQYSKIESAHISVSRFLDYLVQMEFIEPLQKITDELPEKLEAVNNSILDTIRLVTFSINQNMDGEFHADESFHTNIIDFVDEQINKLKSNLEESKEIKEQSELQLNERLHAINDKLSYYSFVNSAKDLKQYIKTHEGKKLFAKTRKTLKTSNKKLGNLLSQVWYRQSRGVLLAKRLKQIETNKQAKVNDLLNIVDKISFKAEVINKIPFYYKQLFLRKQHYLNEFWFGRERELNQARNSIKRYKSGYYGGILIHGDRNSGKTFFSQYIAYKLYENSTSYFINPPNSGSILKTDFKNTLQNAFELKGDYKTIFNNIPENSIVVFENIELWWEKSEKGFDVLNVILDLIEKYSNKCLFVVTVNTHSFSLMNKIKKLESSFINIIECAPFNAEQIKEIIYFRHKSSGLKFKIRKRHEDLYLSWNYAKLFNKYFNYSKGNVGVALQSWIANITDFNGKVLEMNYPKIPDIEALENLETEWLNLLVQFVLDKRLSIERLLRITLLEKDQLIKKINILMRSGLIVENTANVFETNQF